MYVDVFSETTYSTDHMITAIIHINLYTLNCT